MTFWCKDLLGKKDIFIFVVTFFPEEIVCKLRKQRPVIQRDSLKDVKVSHGQTIKLSAKVSGEPEPTKVWYYGKIEIKACPSVDIVETEHSIKVTLLIKKIIPTETYFKSFHRLKKEIQLIPGRRITY